MPSSLNTLGIALASYFLGVITGYWGGGFIKRSISGDNANYKNLVLVLVSLAWFISVIYELINPLFHTSPLVHGLMGGIVGFFFKTAKP